MKARRKQEVDRVRVTEFALFSTLRQEEITRILWSLIIGAGQANMAVSLRWRRPNS